MSDHTDHANLPGNARVAEAERPADARAFDGARFIIGDTRKVLATLPDASVDLVLSSPPFLALRSYLPDDDPNKALEMGSEPTPGDFLDALLDVVEECRRVLKPTGSLAFELGDTYSGSGGAGGDYTDTGLRAGQQKFSGSALQHRRTAQRNRKIGRKEGDYPDRDDYPRPARSDRRVRSEDEAAGILAARKRLGPEQRDDVDGWPLDKSLCLVPELFRVALVYGFNPLTGRQTPRWRARNVVRWCRPNPPVGALADKVRPATSDMVIACMDRKRYWNGDSVRVPASPNTNARLAKGVEARPNMLKTSPDGNRDSLAIIEGNGTAPPLDHQWFDDTFGQDAWLLSTQGYKGSHYATWPEDLVKIPVNAMCPPGGVVLDPFAGSGTTLAVAVGLGRRAIGIDLDRRNADLAYQRVGMFLTIEEAA